MMSYTCLYSGQEEEKSVKRIFSNLFSMITNPSKSCGVVAMIFLRWILLLMLILGKHLVDPCDLVVWEPHLLLSSVLFQKVKFLYWPWLVMLFFWCRRLSIPSLQLYSLGLDVVVLLHWWRCSISRSWWLWLVLCTFHLDVLQTSPCLILGSIYCLQYPLDHTSSASCVFLHMILWSRILCPPCCLPVHPYLAIPPAVAVAYARKAWMENASSWYTGIQTWFILGGVDVGSRCCYLLGPWLCGSLLTCHYHGLPWE